MFPPFEVILQIGYGAAASAAVLLFTWPWRERGWPVPVALGAGVATCAVAATGFPALWPVARADRLFHFAVGGALLGAIEARFRLPWSVRWGLRAAACAGCAWAFLPAVDPAWKTAAAAAGAFVAWSAIEWRAARVEGYGGPAALAVVAGAGSLTLAFGHSGLLGQLAGALSAGAVPLFLYAFVRPRLTVARGGVTAFSLVALPLWISGWRLADVPLESAALLAVAPVAMQRRWWLGVVITAVAAGFAVYLSIHANPDTYDPALGY